MALEDFLPALASQIGEISGLDGNVYYPHPDNGNGDTGLPAKLIVTPCAAIIPLTGIQMFGGSYVATHQLEVIVYACASYNPTTLGLAIPFIKLMRDKLGGKISLGLSSVQHATSALGNFYEGPRGYNYAEEPYTGVKFFVEVKEVDTFTVAA